MYSVSVTTIARDGQVLQSQVAEVSSLGQTVGQACFLVSTSAIRMAKVDCFHLVAIEDVPHAMVGSFLTAEGGLDLAAMARALRELEET